MENNSYKFVMPIYNMQASRWLLLLDNIYYLSLSLVAKSCPTLVTPWTVARQVPLSMGFSRQEYWSGLPFPSPGDLPHPGIDQGFLHYRQILYQMSYEGSSILQSSKFNNTICIEWDCIPSLSYISLNPNLMHRPQAWIQVSGMDLNKAASWTFVFHLPPLSETVIH